MATAAADKSPLNRLPHTDTLDTEIRMSDDDFNTGLTTAVHCVQKDRDNQQLARQKSRTDPTPDTNTWEKRVKFATTRYIEQC